MSRSGTPNSMVLLDGTPLIDGPNNITNRPTSSSGAARRGYLKQNGRDSSMEILSDHDDKTHFFGKENRTKPDQPSRRTPTPNKQISLRAARKAEHSVDLSDDISVSESAHSDVFRPNSGSSTSSGSSESTETSISESTTKASSRKTSSTSTQKASSSTIDRQATKTRVRPQTTNAVSKKSGARERQLSNRTASPAGSTRGSVDTKRAAQTRTASPSSNPRSRRQSSVSPRRRSTNQTSSRSPVPSANKTNRRPSKSPANQVRSPVGGRKNSRSPSAKSRLTTRKSTVSTRSSVTVASSSVPSSESSESFTSGPSTSGSDHSLKSSFRPPSEVSRVLTPKDMREEAAIRTKNKGREAADMKMIDLEDSDAFDTDLEDGEEESDSDSEEENKAPSQLLMEFIQCLMDGELDNAKKLCKMILIYEPDNPEAVKFQTLIDEKITLEAELEAMSSTDSDDSDDSDDDSDDSDGDDSDDSDSDSSSTDSDESGSTQSKSTSDLASVASSIASSSQHTIKSNRSYNNT